MAIAAQSTELHLEIRDINKMLNSEIRTEDQPQENIADIIDSIQFYKDKLVDRLNSVPTMIF